MFRELYDLKSKTVSRIIALVLAIVLVFGCGFESAAAKKASLNKTKVTIHVGSTYKLKLDGVKAISWKSNKKSVATVNSKGKVTAKKKGKAVITCTASNGKKYKCKVTVKDHLYKVNTKKKATKDHKGYAEYVCSECGKSYKKATVYSPTEDQVLSDIKAMKKKYPEGYKWTIKDSYTWDANTYYVDNTTCVGYGCVGFAFLLSDAAFGKYNRSRKVSGSGWYNKIHVGDIVRIYNDSHSVVVLEKKKDSIIVVEGAYNNSVHWGREISMSEVKETGTYLITRYPQ